MSLYVIHGDCRTATDAMPDRSVHCIVTSPPYFGLRDYKVAGQIGMEATTDEYIAAIRLIFRKLHRVLRNDGTAWINLGDSYVNDGHRHRPIEPHTRITGLRPKNLIGMPWRVALALQEDGWILRRDIIWHKPNPMPESCQDRPTTAHEYVFLFSKRPDYFYDAEAIREPVTGTAHPRGNGINPKSTGYVQPAGWDTGDGAHGSIHRSGRRPGKNSRVNTPRDPDHMKREGIKANAQYQAAINDAVSSRNKRSVWTIPSAAYREAHFATFPPDLVKPCILAGCPTRVCQACGAPHRRIVQKGEPDIEHQKACGGDKDGEYHGSATKDYEAAKVQDASAVKARILAGLTARTTVGFEPTCKCNAATIAGTVLDPFAGSGTTGAVALELGRQAVLIELNEDYIRLINERCNQTTPGLALA